MIELKRAAIVLENEQKSHALSKHYPEFVMNRICIDKSGKGDEQSRYSTTANI